jgi:hypothetical protein
MSGQIFISYRHGDSSAWAGRLNDRLLQKFPKTKIFMDVDSLDLGIDFVKEIEGSVGSCEVLIAVIGGRWLTSSNEKRRRRLDDPEDFVRIEIATALRRNIRVFPVLVEGASMPKARDLPDDLKALVRQNALEVSHNRFDADLGRLIAALERVLEKTTEREEKERLEREKKERLETERRQKEEQERLEAERRETKTKESASKRGAAASFKSLVRSFTHPNQSTSVQDILDRLEAARKQRDAEFKQKEEQWRLEAERRETEEKERLPERLEAERRETEAKERLEEAWCQQKEFAERLEARRQWRKNLRPVAGIVTLLAIVIGLVVGATIYFSSHPSKPATPDVSKPPSVTPEATKDHPWENSLGMKFVPVAGTHVLFSVWDTRVEDFERFVNSVGYKQTVNPYLDARKGAYSGAYWKNTDDKQGPTYPVVDVSWEDARAFCEWLTKTEQASGRLPNRSLYRLPTDQEWSVAVGLTSEPGNTPEEKDGKIKVYPWGAQWPPSKGAGNYCGEESRVRTSDFIKGYKDDYVYRSPVGSFAANQFRLYDMGGNVWQWCEDRYKKEYRVLRGASWDGNTPGTLLASCRYFHLPNSGIADAGFRCVVARE